MSNDKISAVGVNIAEKTTMIWNVADSMGNKNDIIQPDQTLDSLITNSIELIQYAR